MNNLTNYLCYELIMMIFDLLSDRDKIQFSMANKYLTSFVPNIIWTNMYQYEKIRFLSYKNNFRKLSFKPRYDIIPPVITHLIIDEKFVGSLANVIPKSVKKIYIDKDSRLKYATDIPANIIVFCKCEFDKKYCPNKVSSLVSSCCLYSYYPRTINIGNFYSANLCTEINYRVVQNDESNYELHFGDYYERLLALTKTYSKNKNTKVELALAILTSSKPIVQTERLCSDILSISKPKPKSKHKKIYPNHAQQKISKHITIPKQKFSKYRR
ncbi:putative F-box and FNIP repeat-containing protein [Megavirus vitis]|uniref:Putative F-box and FNIP repeat-containing protein n=1 Tax=Megavirus courdo7 TaxID=1128135 RepID=H2ECA9_9VIRU|nr:putative F-box and FNIP repeat-containing protein [Megavirus courdo7]AVL94266.1 putative F-box and FNIP repeat-containing protein [Megavirus vitis]